LSTLYSEFKRRNVFRVAALYLVAAWLIAQVADVVIGLGELPTAVGRVILIILALGFPVAVTVAWFFEWTSEGIRRESEAATDQAAQPARRRLDYVILSLLLVALGYFAATHDWSGSVPVANASIAVLPFENRSAEPDDLYFTDGIHEDILTQLGRISSLVVISRTSVMQYRNSSKTIPEIAAELGVSTILEGGVQRAGKRVRINLQLIDSATDKHLWAETFDRELSVENVFAIQSEIATTIAGRLHARLLPQERARIEQAPTRNLEAYDSYLLGRRQLASREVRELERARQHFGRAIGLDPQFALAYAGLADSLALLALLGEPDGSEGLLEEGEIAARKGLELNPDLGEAHTSLGVIMQSQGKPVEIYAGYLERGVELAPGSADARKWYASYLSEAGRYEEALEQLENAVQLDPMSPIVRVNLAGILERFGRHEEALRHVRRALEIDPTFMPAIMAISDVVEADQVLILISAAYRARNDLPMVLMPFVLTYLGVGDAERAEAWVNEMDRIDPEAWQTRVAHLNLSLYRLQHDEAVAYASELVHIENGIITVPTRTLLLDDLRRGRPEAALARYETKYPDLLTDDPQVAGNYSAAIDVAMLFQALREHRKANRLLERSLAFLDSLPRGDRRSSGIFRARIHALRGEGEAAVAAIRGAIDTGWTFQWWFYLLHDPAFDTLRADPRFQTMTDEMAERARRELVRVRELEESGNIALPPEW